MSSLVQIVGSVLILVPFVLAQRGRLATSASGYVVANTVGSGVLAVDALLGEQWGFLLLEGTWAIVSAVSLAQWAVSRRVSRRFDRRDAAHARTR